MFISSERATVKVQYQYCHSVFYLLLVNSDHMENIDGYLMKYTNLVTGWQYR